MANAANPPSSARRLETLPVRAAACCELVEEWTVSRQGLDGSEVLEPTGEREVCISQQIVRTGSDERHPAL
jgi:hypothetical protein